MIWFDTVFYFKNKMFDKMSINVELYCMSNWSTSSLQYIVIAQALF